MSEFGWIKLHRRITEWQHWSNPSVLATFIHLLTLANYEPKRWNGIVVERGQLVTSERNFAEDVGLARSTLRRVLLTLQETGEISMEQMGVGNRKDYTVITILNYDQYQGENADLARTTSDTTDSENCEPQARPRRTPMNTSSLDEQSYNSGPQAQGGTLAGVDRTKEYIRNNIYNYYSYSSRKKNFEIGKDGERVEGETPKNYALGTEGREEERKKVAGKKERIKYRTLKESNEEVIAEIKNNSEWVGDTAKLFSTSREKINEALSKFGLFTTTTHKELKLPDTYAHFQLWMNHEIKAQRARAKPRGKPKAKEPSNFWSTPEAKAIEERNRREGEELLKKYKIKNK